MKRTKDKGPLAKRQKYELQPLIVLMRVCPEYFSPWHPFQLIKLRVLCKDLAEEWNLDLPSKLGFQVPDYITDRVVLEPEFFQLELYESKLYGPSIVAKTKRAVGCGALFSLYCLNQLAANSKLPLNQLILGPGFWPLVNRAIQEDNFGALTMLFDLLRKKYGKKGFTRRYTFTLSLKLANFPIKCAKLLIANPNFVPINRANLWSFANLDQFDICQQLHPNQKQRIERLAKIVLEQGSIVFDHPEFERSLKGEAQETLLLHSLSKHVDLKDHRQLENVRTCYDHLELGDRDPMIDFCWYMTSILNDQAKLDACKWTLGNWDDISDNPPIISLMIDGLDLAPPLSWIRFKRKTGLLAEIYCACESGRLEWTSNDRELAVEILCKFYHEQPKRADKMIRFLSQKDVYGKAWLKLVREIARGINGS